MPAMDVLLVQSAFIPFCVALVSAGVLRFAAGPTHGPAMAGAAVALAFLTGYVLIFGAPTVWPPSASQKIFFVAIIGGIFGMSLDLSREARHIKLLPAALMPSAAAVWLGWPRLMALDGPDIVTLVILAIAGGVVLTECLNRNAQPPESAVKLLIAAGTLGLIALFGRSASYAQLCGILAAGVAGFFLWLWPLTRCRFAASAVFGGGLVFIALAGAIGLYTTASKPALGLLLPIFFADRALGRFDTGIRKLNHAVKPVLLGVIALIPAIAAVGLAHLLGSGGY